MNLKLKRGLKLPIPNLLVADLSQSDLVQFDHFIMVEADPKVKPDDVKRIVQEKLEINLLWSSSTH